MSHPPAENTPLRGSTEQFGPLAAEYAHSSYHASGPDLEPMVEAAALTGAERVLDVGCGPGHTALRFAPRVQQVVAVDPTDTMLAQGRALARERGLANLRFEQASAERLPYPEESFDRVVSRQSAHHWSDVPAAAREIRRVLRGDGLLVLIDTFAPEDDELDAFLNRIELLRDPSHVRDRRVSEWTALMAEAAVELEARASWELGIEFTSWVRRSRTAEDRVQKLRATLAGASEPCRAFFRISPEGDFVLPYGLVLGRPV